MPAMASSRSGSAPKKWPMSFAILTRCSDVPCPSLPCPAPAESLPATASLLMGPFILFVDEHDIGALQQGFLGLAELAEALLPLGGLAHPDGLHGGHLVLGAIRGPVGIIRGDHIGSGFGKMKSRIDHAGLNPLGHPGAQHRVAGAALDAHPVPFGNAAVLRILRMDLQTIFVMPRIVLRAPGLRTHVVLAQDASGRQDQGVASVDFLRGGHVLGHQEFALAPHELADVHGRRALGDRKSTRLNSSHMSISYAVFCLKKKKKTGSLRTPLDNEYEIR